MAATTEGIEKEPLRWLFRAHFQDGTVITQDLDDTCNTRTDGTGSAFTDVLAKGEEPLYFELISQANPDDTAAVDLITGNFVVNRIPICAHEQNFDPEAHTLQLIYFRETRVEQTQDDFGKPISERHYVNRYFIGWKTNINGKNHQATIAVG